MIHESKTGICKTRINVGGKIFTLVYGNISSISNNPIEKKPFFHFAPGTYALTVGSWGCNATCLFCQNYDISKQPPVPKLVKYLSPEQFVDMAIKRGSNGISISFNEAPTLMLEWNLEVFDLAKKKGLYTTIVTNGYMTREALDLMINAGLDAANVDVKGCEPAIRKICGIRLQPVLNNIVHMRNKGVHVELTTLVVPKLSDDIQCLTKIADWIIAELGKKVPWHLNRYYPAYKYKEPLTSLDVLLEARQMAFDTGLEFVYVGNVGGPGLEDTICPNCGALSVQRTLFSSKVLKVDANGFCSNCGYDLKILGLKRV